MVTLGQVADDFSVFCPGTPGWGWGRRENRQVVTGTLLPWLWWHDVVALAARWWPWQNDVVALAARCGGCGRALLTWPRRGFAFRNGARTGPGLPGAGLPQLRG